MGNTTRREPVSSKIPSSPDYKFLNITNFKGIHKSDNPFLVDSTTASDALNVYVDENNALTTRPRVEKMKDMSSLFDELLYVYPLDNGDSLWHIKKGRDISLMRVGPRGHYSEVKNQNKLPIPSTKLVVLAYKDYVYVMTSSDYYIIELDDDGYLELSRVEDHPSTYVPVTEISTFTKDGVTGTLVNESRNLLTSKYKKEYYWDLLSDPAEILVNSISKENRAFHISDASTAKFTKDTKVIGDGEYLSKTSDTLIKWSIVDNKIKLDRSAYVGSRIVFPSTTGECYVTYHQGDVNSDMILEVYDFKTQGLKTTITIPSTESQSIHHIYVTDNYNSLIVSRTEYDSKNSSNINILELYYKNEKEEYIKRELLRDSYETTSVGVVHHHIDFYVRSDESAILAVSHDSGATVFSDLLADRVVSTKAEIPILAKYPMGADYLCVSKDFTELMFHNNSVLYYSNLGDDGKYTNKEFNNRGSAQMIFAGNGENVFYVSAKGIRGFDISKEKEYLVYDYTDETVNPIVLLSDLTHLVVDQNTQNVRVIYYLYDALTPNYVVTYKQPLEEAFEYGMTNVVEFENNWWFYGNKNLLYWTNNHDPTYITINTKKILGAASEPIVDAVLVSTSALAVMKKNEWYLVALSQIGEGYSYTFPKAKSVIGAIARAGITTPYTETPIYVNENGFYTLTQLEYVQSSDHVSQMVSVGIEPKFKHESNKKNIFSSANLYWTYFFLPDGDITKVYVLDDRTGAWYYWELPFEIISSWYHDDKTYLVDSHGISYVFATTDVIIGNNTYYHDDGDKLIEWRWVSQILPMGTINYTKKLNTTTFIMTDTDEKDDYCLDYKFKVFRKVANESNPTTISNSLNYIRSVTKKTIISRFNFLQLELSNSPKSDAYSANNKLRLIGIGFKYELLAGLM